MLINGGMMTFPTWEPIAAVLEQRFRVLRFDFRGQLLSPGDPPLRLSGHVDDLVALLDELGIESAHLIGASFGALVAVHLAAARPERVRSLLLVTAMDRITDAFRRDSDRMRGILASILAGGDRGAFYEALMAGVYSTAFRRREAKGLAARRAQLDQLPLAWFAAVDRLLAALEGFDLAPQLARVRAPAEVIIAADDGVMEPGRSFALAEAIGATVKTHPTAGHGLVVEDPVWVAEVALEFLDRLERRPA